MSRELLSPLLLGGLYSLGEGCVIPFSIDEEARKQFRSRLRVHKGDVMCIKN